MYSQSHEETVIVSYFGDRVGRFLDVGAHNGVNFSNTRRLVELGWEGVLVEPEAKVFGDLVHNCRGQKGLVLVNAALEPTRRICRFYGSRGDFISSTSVAHRDKWLRDGGKFDETWIQTLAVSDFFSVFPGPYNFISVDTEGTTLDVFFAMPIDALGVEMLCIECKNADRPILEARCKAHGLTHMEQVFCNLLVSR